MSSPDDIFGLGDDPGGEIFLSDSEDEEGPTRDGAGPSGDDEQPVLSNRTMLRKLCFCFYIGFNAGKLILVLLV